MNIIIIVLALVIAISLIVYGCCVDNEWPIISGIILVFVVIFGIMFLLR
jgi:hypothetical protein